MNGWLLPALCLSFPFCLVPLSLELAQERTPLCMVYNGYKRPLLPIEMASFGDLSLPRHPCGVLWVSEGGGGQKGWSGKSRLAFLWAQKRGYAPAPSLCGIWQAAAAAWFVSEEAVSFPGCILARGAETWGPREPQHRCEGPAAIPGVRELGL